MQFMKFDKHIFICTHDRGKNEKRSCGEDHGMALVKAFKKCLKDKKLTIKVRAQRAGCLDVCIYGPTMVVYPEGVFYVGVKLSDVEEIVEDHIIKNNPVKRLILKEDK